ncbi:MAG: hypothetical protein IPM29_17150 [Planctomycetes bacterium]|nr:hypothetical protein [Planctomycetota bacterium]
MFDATLIQTENDGAAVSLFGPWLPRLGEQAMISMDLIALSQASLTVVLFHKDRDDVGDGTQVGFGAITRVAVGRTTARFDPLKELVRYKITVETTEEGEGAWALFRMLSIVWYDSVTA